MDDKGNALVRVRGLLFTASNALPGDEVKIASNLFASRASRKDAQRRSKKARAYPLLFSRWKRFAPFCAHYGVCGGCDLQQLSYADQLALKQQHVRQLLVPYADARTEALDIVSAERTMYYRNRVDYTLGASRWMYDDPYASAPNASEKTSGSASAEGEQQDRRGAGFHVRGFYDKVVHVEHCFLHESNEIRKTIHAWAVGHGAPYYNSRAHSGLLRLATVRSSLLGQTMLCIVHAKSENPREIADLCETLLRAHPEITSLYTAENNGGNDTPDPASFALHAGAPFIEERCAHVRLKIYPQVFYQTNSLQAEKLYETIARFARADEKSRVLDLYCGIGSIGLYCAKDAARVVGVDIVPQSIAAARENAEHNGVHNAQFFALSSEDAAAGVAGEQAEPALRDALAESNVVIVDPPRAGLHKNVIAYLREKRAQRLVYAACNPATLARDIELLSDRYRMARYQAVDMFPHTHHVETVVELHPK